MSEEITSSVPVGAGIVVVDPDTALPVFLDGDGVPIHRDGETRLYKGTAGSPLQFPGFKSLLVGESSPYLVGMNGGGVMYRIPSNPDPAKKVLMSADGVFSLQPVPSTPCFDVADICSDCEADYGVAWKAYTDVHNVTKLCLIRTPVGESGSSSGTFFKDTNTARVLGSGTSSDKYNVNVVVDPSPQNLIQVKSSGLFVGISASPGNALQIG